MSLVLLGNIFLRTLVVARLIGVRTTTGLRTPVDFRALGDFFDVATQVARAAGAAR